MRRGAIRGRSQEFDPDRTPFQVRLRPVVRRYVEAEAERRKVSMNTVINDVLEDRVTLTELADTYEK